MLGGDGQVADIEGLASALCLTRAEDVVDRVRALGCPALGGGSPALVYSGTFTRWLDFDRLAMPKVLAALVKGDSIVNCVDLAALCHALIAGLGGRATGVRSKDCQPVKLTAGVGVQPMGCPPPSELFTCVHHYALADVPTAGGGPCWVDTTLGPSPWVALRAGGARGYAEAAFAKANKPVLTGGVLLYSSIEWVTPSPLLEGEGSALLGLAAVDGGPQLVEPWRSIFWGDEAALAEPGATGGLLRRSAEVFRLVEAGTVRGPIVFERIVLGRVEPARLELQPVTGPADFDGAVRVELAIYADPQRAKAALRAAGEALPQPQGAPALWSPLDSLGARPEGVLLRQTRWGEVMLTRGRALLRVQPLRRDAGPARNLAVERLLAVMS
jgi:hypothetical protein